MLLVYVGISHMRQVQHVSTRHDDEKVRTTILKLTYIKYHARHICLNTVKLPMANCVYLHDGAIIKFDF